MNESKFESLKSQTTTSATETMQLAAKFAKTLKGGELISLIGDLGAGKTTFTRGLVEALGGVVGVKSPTFTVMNEYTVQAGSIKRVVHVDFYRFTQASELEALALEDEHRPDTVIVAEWPDVLGHSLVVPDITVTFKHLNLDEREILITDVV